MCVWRVCGVCLCVCVYVCVVCVWCVCVCGVCVVCVCVACVWCVFVSLCVCVLNYILLLLSQHAPLHYVILRARFVLFNFIWLFVVSFS